MTARPFASRSFRRPALFLIVLVVGAGIAHFAMPPLFRSIHTDVSRIAVILDAVHRSDPKPTGAVFGNSIVESGVDVSLLSQELPGNPLILNLASPDQSPAESYLLYQELPQSIRLIVQMLMPRALMTIPALSRNKFNAFYMYGYRPGERTRSTLRRLLGDEAHTTIEASDATQRFRARWSIQQLLDIRPGRPNHAAGLDGWMRDAFFVQRFDERLPREHFESTLDLWVAVWTAPDVRALATTRGLLAEESSVAAAKGWRFVVLVPPMHPRVRARIPPAFHHEFEAVLAEARSSLGIQVVDASDLLAEEDFRDSIHLLARGSARLTAFLAEGIRHGLP